MNPVIMLIAQHNVLIEIGCIIGDLLLVLVGLKVLQLVLEHTEIKIWLQKLIQGGKRVAKKFDKFLIALVDNRE